MMYGHVDTPRTGSAHMRADAPASRSETGGFTEFVLLPFVHTQRADLPGRARPARGRPCGENRAVHAMARILLHGGIDNIQMLLGEARRTSCARRCCSGGVNDLGGTLMEETISRMAGSENGSYKTISDLEAHGGRAGRPARQRTTTYGVPDAERLAAAAASDGVCQSVRLGYSHGGHREVLTEILRSVVGGAGRIGSHLKRA